MTAQLRTLDGIRFLEARPSQSTSPTTFLLLHGLGGALEFWAPTVPVLGRRWRTIAVDIPGFGRSRNPEGALTLDSMSRDLAAFCRALDITHCVLVSHSIGGAVAGRLAARLPDTICRVILVSGSLLLAAQIAQNPLRGLAHPRVGIAVAAQFSAGMMPLPGFLQRLTLRSALLRRIGMWPFVAHPELLRPEQLGPILANSGSLSVLKILLSARSINYVEAVNLVPQPVDLVWGGADRLIRPADVIGMLELMDVRRELEIPECGHWPMIEKFDELTNFLLTWETDESGRRADQADV